MFQKVASVTTLGWLDGGTVTKTAQVSPASYFLDGARTLDVRALLERVGESYAISTNPEHYFFEAIRANTTSVPNENNDAFTKAELLNFNPKIGMPVYRTYAGKPHHLNHKTDNPRAARGVIIDAHYNTDSPPLEVCPSCDLRTAERQNRDESGLHCKCGTTVKDEFVEILVAIDAHKDPTFADGVRKGLLKSGSMGCNCLSTTCNVCGHVAYARPDFCAHIKAGNKGSLWAKSARGWVKTSAADVVREAKRRKLVFSPRDFCFLRSADGSFEVRRAYEKCNDVVFDEYSRVDQPADPKALQVEILHTASADVSAEALKAETALLIEATLARQAKAAAPMPQHGLNLQLQPGDEPLTIQPPMGGEEPPAPGEVPGANPGAPPPGDIPIEDLSEEWPMGQPPPNEEMDLAELGVLPTPPGAAAPRKKGTMNFAAYKDWVVEISEQGNARLLNGKQIPVALFRGSPAADESARRAFGEKIIASLLSDGLVKTAQTFKAVFSPRFAQVVDGGENDMQGFKDHEMVQNPIEGGETDMADVDRASTAPASTRDEAETADDMVPGSREDAPDSAVEGGAADHEVAPANIDNVTDQDETDMREKRSPVNVATDSVLSDAVFDHAKVKKGSMNLQAMIGQRVAAKSDPSTAFQVARVCKSASKSEKQIFGDYSVVLSGPTQRRISAATLLDKWFALDKGPGTIKLPGKPAKVVTAAKCSKEGCDKDGAAGGMCADHKHEARAAKLEVTKLARAQRDVAAARREVELVKAEVAQEVSLAKKAAVEAFARAMRIVAKRHESNLEDSPIKLAAEAVLSEPRVVGTDAASGQPITFPGLNPELTRYLVAQLFSLGHADHLDTLMSRAAQLMAKGDQYLLDAEQDVQNLRPALEPITASFALDDSALHAEAMRREASNGNPQFNPAPSEFEDAGQPNHRRGLLQHALKNTVVANHRGRLGLG